VVLTNSDGEQDIRHAYKLYANSYLIKPVQMDEFLRKIRCLETFWLKVVRLPHEAY
jgi:two-component system, chemotaxis family, response regulator Rcp1